MPDFSFSAPTRIHFGIGALREVEPELERIGGRRALLVTDHGVAAAGLAERLERALGARLAATFAEVEPDSSVEAVERCAEAGRAAGCDSIVSLGGGSVIDTAKLAGVLLRFGGRLLDYHGFQMLSAATVPHVAVPTTAGTGSEVSYAAVVKDRRRRSKLVFGDYELVPEVAVLDPELIVTLPRAQTVATGIDALTHAVEAIHSAEHQPLADALALHALRLIRRNLVRCVEAPDDLEARGGMLIAATMAGIAFSNAQVGIVHAIAHSLGALAGLTHGTANGVILPHGMRFNLEAAGSRYALVGEALGADGDAEAAIEAVAELSRAIGQPQTLRELGVTREDLPEIAEAALADASIVYNPRRVTRAEDVLEILEAAW